ncbi:WecB/TagA/CpsF family glycosyltransferase [Ruminococcus flavefaciens]|uniref:N-acetylglucosaminyldiphosphoundecaprenol N-acetyl-beta-D-mannosaminyltransferase n=1 Tax=Ruminococcus flavefaciens TaxID=1265 RepID=A0A1M7IC80_RUMFL|nr:WecB/TagA/CpsF family glycosyltransferase [Ruminococcus flavefaciens]SHM38203.1 N-acetylglucosaminyldiphosphoundecaprenol N-acetyl-beta-D-mannosaminyltransferase [Ruminococcus flavefaciens]
MKNERVKIIGVPISAVNMESCIANIYEDLDKVKGQYICVSNVHTTVMAHDDPKYFKVQADSFMSVPDGKPLSMVGKKQYPNMDRVTGPDLMRRIFEESKNRLTRHYFYGNNKENLEKLIKVIKKKYPQVVICGYEPSVFRDMSKTEEQELAERINTTNPDFVWVALGAPRQEFFCNRMVGKINGLMIGVGGAFNVLAGIVPEAPIWMQKLCLEWFYRFIQEPRRLFKRYAVTNTKFIWYLITDH